MKRLILTCACLLILVYIGSGWKEHDATARFQETTIILSDNGITVNGGVETSSVFTSHDIIYYEDKDFYDGGYAYGAGSTEDRHSEQEAAEHTVVNITAPGTYRICGKLSKGQIRVDLGKGAYNDPKAVVNVILSNTDITCTVAPVVLFLNVYECDGNWTTQHATRNVDTTRAGANLILEGNNCLDGSHVAKIYKENGKHKKLWKQDGAIHSYMSLNISGSGKLDLTADWEGISSELHMTIWGGDIVVRAQNDGINCNEEKVSVLNINGGFLHVLSGLFGGDGLDSNGFMVIRGGTVLVSGQPYDSPLDADYGTFIDGGTILGFGAFVEADIPSTKSEQSIIYLNLYHPPAAGRSIAVTDKNGNVVLGYDPSRDEILGQDARTYFTAILSCPDFAGKDSYNVWYDAEICGESAAGVYRDGTLTSGTRMQEVVPLLSDIPNGLYLYDGISFFYGTPPDMK